MSLHLLDLVPITAKAVLEIGATDYDLGVQWGYRSTGQFYGILCKKIEPPIAREDYILGLGQAFEPKWLEQLTHPQVIDTLILNLDAYQLTEDTLSLIIENFPNVETVICNQLVTHQLTGPHQLANFFTQKQVVVKSKVHQVDAQWAVSIATRKNQALPIELVQLQMAPTFMEVRTLLPSIAMNSLPRVLIHNIKNGESFPKVNQQRKILIVQRQIVNDPSGWKQSVKRLLQQGWLLVAEWDDHPQLLPEAIRKMWDQHPWMPISTTHACQVSTAPLSDVFSPYTGAIQVFKNAVLDCLPVVKKSDPPIILFAALNRESVNEWIAPVLKKIQAQFQSRLIIVRNKALFTSLVGNAYHEQSIQVGRGSYKALLTEDQRIMYFDTLTYDDYSHLLSCTSINLLPLSGSQWEMYKSDLKFIESAARGAVCVASPAIYSESISHGETGYLANSPDEWISCIHSLLENKTNRETMALAAYDYVRSHRMLAHHVQDRIQWYDYLLDNQRALTHKLYERHPDLA